jgi:sulfur-oxidizing protein SoxX
LCHAGPLPEERFQGNLAPNLPGAASAGVKPIAAAHRRRRPHQSGHHHAGLLSDRRLDQCRAGLRGKPILDAQQVEDVVAYLRTLKEKEGD